MVTGDMKTSEWLEDLEIRSEYGAATLQYDIAAVLVAARKMENLTQAALANMTGVSQAYIAKLESGEANPTIGRIGAILASMWLKTRINLVQLRKSPENTSDEIPTALKEAAARADQRSNLIPLQRYLNSRSDAMRAQPDEVISRLAR